MANNELSGPIVAMGLINYFKTKKLNKTLRFIFIPETIGSISYLNLNLKYLKNNVIGGYNLSCIGDDRQHSCMLSKYKNSPSDEAVIDAYKFLKLKNIKFTHFYKGARTKDNIILQESILKSLQFLEQSMENIPNTIPH